MRRPWALYDSAGRCLSVGSVEADSDAEAVRKALLLEHAGVRRDGWYRVKAGSAAASCAGDEFASTSLQAAGSHDQAGTDAQRARQAEESRRAAERALRDHLADKVRARALEREARATPRPKALMADDIVRRIAELPPTVPTRPASRVLTGVPHRAARPIQVTATHDRAHYGVVCIEARGVCSQCGEDFVARHFANEYDLRMPGGVLDALVHEAEQAVARVMMRPDCQGHPTGKFLVWPVTGRAKYHGGGGSNGADVDYSTDALGWAAGP